MGPDGSRPVAYVMSASGFAPGLGGGEVSTVLGHQPGQALGVVCGHDATLDAK